MSNKPMLSVELRVLLERLLSHDFAEECQECGIGYSDAWSELRALLDADKVNSREMGLMQYVDAHPIKSAKTDLVECDACPTSGGCVSVCMKAPKTAAQHQGEPVAYQIRRRTDREDSAWTKWQECSEMERAMHSHEVRKYNRFGIMREIRALYAEQPAPVSMVMPELKTPYYKVVPTKFGNKEGFWQITPDSSIVYDNRDEAQARADARNASRAQHFFDSLKPCLEEVARLNGVNL